MSQLGGDVAKARLAATLLLTMPGVPFIHYGEEIGMTDQKPDKLIRLPSMEPRRVFRFFGRISPAAGESRFSDGEYCAAIRKPSFPFEPLSQSDSLAQPAKTNRPEKCLKAFSGLLIQ